MLNNKKENTDEQAGMTVRQRLRQKRELEEKRKFGLAPLCVDAVSGQEISPNVPHLISQAPWYYGSTGPTLEHQRQKNVEAIEALNDQRDAVKVFDKPKTYVAGACGNCGSVTHKTHECYKPRKKVGAMYSGKVTGVSMSVECVEKNYAQKRDRYAMGIGVDLLQSMNQDGGVADQEDQGGHNDGSGGEKRSKLEDVFASKTAVSGGGGGVAIKELPKHLHNLDDDGLFFDPKTGSMRGNPNAADPTKIFQGDLQRYRSGDYYTYLEMQLRFLKGESSSFVDFRLDEQLQKEKQQQTIGSSGGNPSGGGESVGETAHDRLVRSLYGDSTLVSSGNAQKMREALAAASAYTSCSAPDEDTLATSAPSSSHALGPATRNGHLYVYGSYFDTKEFRWGYKCCKRLGREAEACKMEKASTTKELE
ncbi:uncharacterized protein TEOVI_000700900 [Trypanosoma equiperdum]|uniref:Pre-mRNA-splicing factor SLU7 n=2 Tax=Trypanozoon TaxID=39700 RepID=Q57ZX8_TRYB2|nr:hypothetical protein, conserved [Trypanosoma brucei brucei TREU927]AAX79347.1 hypothetical protein, conserved [Trypanosoma brucei]AAZ11415.1 hypothetical protein, conserved [Trypanosoma brucei brucei TREU927]SCU65087.1 hypothetical protein, conserved [Trypanosoma equiperdum]